MMHLIYSFSEKDFGSRVGVEASAGQSRAKPANPTGRLRTASTPLKNTQCCTLSECLEHHRGQFGRTHFPALVGLTDVEVLAKDAAEIAHIEKNGAAAPPAPQAILFAQVRKITAHLGITPGFTGGCLVGQPVHPANTRTDSVDPNLTLQAGP